MPRIICTASCVGFFKVLNERLEGKAFAFFFLCLALLDTTRTMASDCGRGDEIVS